MFVNPFKKKPKITFWADNEIISKVYPLVPSNKFIPEWYRKLPQFTDKSNTVKRCPGIMKYLTHGYIVRTWLDVTIHTDVKHNNIKIEYTEDFRNIGRKNVFNYFQTSPPITLMNEGTFGDPNPFPDNTFKRILKWQLGWHAQAPKGFDIWFAPLQYHFNPNFTATIGMMDSRITEQLNIQVLWHPTESEVYIPAGTPLVQLIPVRREEIDHEILYDKDGKNAMRLKEKFARYWLRDSDRLNFMNEKYFDDSIDDADRSSK
jgi:hypothetical protein